MFYLNGNGVTRDVAAAIKWFERACEGYASDGRRLA
ncbi:SEL1-like repeat protein [Bradyrhizobium sp. JR3.5]